MDRRSFLSAGTLALAGLAGCVAGEDPAGIGDTGGGTPTTTLPTTTDPSTDLSDGSPVGSPTPTTATETAPEDYGAVEVAADAVQPAVVYLLTPDSIGVMDDLNGADQFLSLSIDAASPAPPRSAFELRFDGATYPPASPGGATLWRTLQSPRYPRDDGTGWLLFALPATGDVSDVALTWPGGEWPLPASPRQRLAAPPPSFSVSFDAPETVPAGSDPSPTVTVTNEGSTAGRFVGALNRIGPAVAYTPIAAITVDVPAGETVTRPVEDSFSYGPTTDGGDADARYVFRWPGGTVERTVAIHDA